MGKGCICKIADGVLFYYFANCTIFSPLMDVSTCLPSHLVPSFWVAATRWYVETSDDYLVAEAPPFFVGIACMDLFIHWPLAFAALYAIAKSKPWFSTLSLIYGVSSLSFLAALIPVVTHSKQASVRTFVIYYSYLGYALLALFRGLLGICVGKGEQGPVVHGKKRA